jgi:hypothetical protein
MDDARLFSVAGMSSKKIPFSMGWAQAVSNSDLDRSTKFFALTLYLFMDTKGACWPSTKTLQERTERPRSWVSTQRTKLEKAGFLTVDRTAALASKSSCLHQALIPSPVPYTEQVPVPPAEQRSKPVKRSEPRTKKEKGVLVRVDSGLGTNTLKQPSLNAGLAPNALELQDIGEVRRAETRAWLDDRLRGLGDRPYHPPEPDDAGWNEENHDEYDD